MFVCFVDWVYEWLIQRLNRPFPVKPVLRTTIGAALLAGWYLLMTVPAARLLDANSGVPAAFTVLESSPVYPLAKSLEDHRWRLVQCEAEPTECGDSFGFRVTLAHDWVNAGDDCGRSQPYACRAYSQFVFVPPNQAGASQPAVRITWQDLDHRPPRWFVHRDPERTVDMGYVNGFHVYGLSSIAQQEVARARLGTVGGEDRLMLLEELLEQSSNDLAYLKAIRMIALHGASAVPMLEREIERNGGLRKYALIKSLGGVPGPESAARLELLFRDPASRNLVAYALCEVPPREDLMNLYIDLVRTDSSSSVLARTYEAFLQFEPKKAELAFVRMREAPRTILHFAAATRGLRAVHGVPFSEDVENAGSALRVARYFIASQTHVHGDVDQARSLLTGTTDIEAAIIIALEAAAADHRQGLSLKQSPGADVLLSLPETRVTPLLTVLASVVTDDGSRAFAREVLEHCSNHAEHSAVAQIARASI